MGTSVRPARQARQATRPCAEKCEGLRRSVDARVRGGLGARHLPTPRRGGGVLRLESTMRLRWRCIQVGRPSRTGGACRRGHRRRGAASIGRDPYPVSWAVQGPRSYICAGCDSARRWASWSVRLVWWVPRPSAGASSVRHASSSVGRLALAGRQFSIGFNLGVAVAVSVAVAVAMAIRRPA